MIRYRSGIHSLNRHNFCPNQAIPNPSNEFRGIAVKHFSLPKVFHSLFRRPVHKQNRRPSWTPRLEPLEERWVPTITVTNQAITATEGVVSANVTVATFTDSDPSPASGYAASIDWGDGTTTPGTISLNPSSGVFSVTGTHTYADETAPSTPLPVTVQIQETTGNMDTGTANSTAAVAEADSLTPGTVTIPTTKEGTPFSGVLGTFTNTNTANSPGDFTATVDWGDGMTTAGTVSGSGGSLTVGGTHTYAEDGQFTVNVTLTDDVPGTQAATATGSAFIAESDLTTTGSTITPTEGQTFSGTVATFTDMGSPDAASAFTASIDWGDDTVTTGTVTGSGGTFSVSGTHVYTDEGSFTGSVQINEAGITIAGSSGTLTASVAEGDALTGSPMVLTATEGQSFSGAVASFTDTYVSSPASDFSANIDWGDGTTSTGRVNGGNGSFAVSGTHTYQEDGSFPVAVTLTENSPGSASARVTSSVDVAEAGVTVSGTRITATEGQPFSGTVATLLDPGSPDPASAYTASIDWGDGTTTTGTLNPGEGSFLIGGTHTYNDEGTFTVQVIVNEAGITNGMAPVSSSEALVNEGDQLTGTGTTLTAAVATPFSGPVATFSDTNSLAAAGDFTASIDWGDGTTTAGTVSGSGGSFTVNGTHTYSAQGFSPVTVTLQDDSPGTANAIAFTGANVLTVNGVTFSATEGQSFHGTVANFTDGNTETGAGNFSANINWGDGTSAAGTIVQNGPGSFAVLGTHTYVDEGSYPVAVAIRSQNSQSAVTAASSARVQDAPLGNDLVAREVCTAEGVPLQGAVVAGFLDPAPEPASHYTAQINWGDGTPATAGTVRNGFLVVGSHTYSSEGSYTITVAVRDGNGSSVSISSSAMVGGFVTRLYADLLGRLPDAGGLAFWVHQLHAGVLSRTQVGAAFYNSAERRGVEVDQFYQTFLHRAADPQGRAGWVNALLQGMSDGQVAIDFLTSAEYTQAHPDSRSYVEGLYSDVLNRGATPGEIAYWQQILDNGARTRAAEAYYFLTSQESYVDAVNGYYQAFLRRPGDAAGMQFYLAMLESGSATPTTVVATFLGSQEYLNLAIALACSPTA
jgi:hypothetical protein